MRWWVLKMETVLEQNYGQKITHDSDGKVHIVDIEKLKRN
jgi:hypothetical protein